MLGLILTNNFRVRKVRCLQVLYVAVKCDPLLLENDISYKTVEA